MYEYPGHGDIFIIYKGKPQNLDFGEVYKLHKNQEIISYAIAKLLLVYEHNAMNI